MQSSVGLDLGTTKVAVAVAVEGDRGGTEVVGVGHAPAAGVRRGMVVDPEQVAEAIRSAVAEAERMAGTPIQRVTVGVGGEHLRSFNIQGVISLGRSPREIGPGDVSRVLASARAVAIPQDRAVLHAVAQEFTVDGQAGLQNPIGLWGSRLEADVHLVTGNVGAPRQIQSAVHRAGLSVQATVPRMLCTAAALLTEEEKELGALLVDLGGGTTEMALFYEGSVRHSAVIGTGGIRITRDLARVFSVPAETAEELKVGHGALGAARIGPNRPVEIDASVSVAAISSEELGVRIEERIDELLLKVSKEARKNIFGDLFAAGVVLTGGGSLLPGILDFAERVFEVPVRRGVPRGLAGVRDAIEDPRFAAAVGLAVAEGEAESSVSRFASPLLSRLPVPVRRWLGGMF